MIVGKVIGGLGNQMFQYVFYKYLATIKSVELRLDISDFESYSLHRGYELRDVFDINEKISKKNIDQFKTRYPLLFKIENKIFSKNYLFGFSHYRENNFFIDDTIFDKNIIDVYVEGYFQTYKYISELSNKGVQLFAFKMTLTPMEEELVNMESVAIHVRGKDYIKNKKDIALFGGICNADYYKKSIKLIEKEVENPRFIVFSDDEEYARSLLNGRKMTVINWNKGADSHRDMFLMSRCKHNIIANSSFSWWGAWMNNNTSKIVVAPSKWFNNNKINQEFIVPQNWKRV